MDWKSQVITTLRKHHACSESVAYVETSTATSLAGMWNSCDRGDWMLWIAAKQLDRKVVVWAACQCARQALKYVKPGEDRPLAAIVMAERWSKGDPGVTIQQVRYAAAAAADAAYAAAAYAAADTAAAAAYAAAAAAYAAAAAAYAAADAARLSSLRESARIIRETITAGMMEASL